MMEITEQRTSALIPYVNNSRTHTPEQVSQIASSIREFGFTNPVLIDGENSIIAGHGRVEAANKLGLEQVPCIRLEHLSDAQKKAYVIADNKLALNAGWDLELLKLGMFELAEMEFDVGLTGFSADELAELMHVDVDALTDEDDVPVLADDPVSTLGDVWMLGKHRLMCGDSTSESDVSTLLGEVRPHLMVTDPPYGVEYDATWRNEVTRKKEGKVHDLAVGAVLNDDNADWREAWALFPGDVAYVWHGGLHSSLVAESLAASGFEIRAQIIWAKNSLIMSRGHYHWQHEPCWYAVRSNAIGHWQGDRKQSTIWQIDKQKKSETGHSTQKPVQCMQRAIENNSSVGQAVYEPFNGSGTTLIAGENTGRAVYAMELHPKYVDIAVQRWEEYTGQTAMLTTGESRQEVMEARG